VILPTEPKNGRWTNADIADRITASEHLLREEQRTLEERMSKEHLKTRALVAVASVPTWIKFVPVILGVIPTLWRF
jgi:hypothetical protein